MQVIISLLLSLCVVMAAVAAADTDCTASDNAIRDKRAWLCDSLAAADTWWCGSDWTLEPNADKDWPNQAVYMQNLLTTLSGTDPACTSSAYYSDTIDFLNYNVMAPEISGNFGWTWDVFQVQYYDMPRKPGDRVESPETLGRKCWAFAYLAQMWSADAMAKIPYKMDNFTRIYQESVPMTMSLCDKVEANCFKNATFDPSRKGSCKKAEYEFHYLGFDRENIKRKSIVHYPWW